jgi:acetoin utilization deacetylase AcuC-like enzyme
MKQTEKVGIIYDDYFLEHKPFYSHPENPNRLIAIVETLKKYGLWDRLKKIDIDDVEYAEVEELLHKVHSEDHIKMVESLKGHYGNIDADTYYSPETSSVAFRAAQASVKAVEEVMKGRTERVFVLARPPGHHATFSEAMGFCFFNNAAVSAEKAKSMGAERVLIVDFDVHHGNGTQEIFWKRDDVLYFSSHRYPFYPGTGRFDEIGEGKGKGYTVNLPLPRGLSDGEYAKLYEEVLVPVIEKFSPDIVIVSAGFDAHYNDPLADMKLTEEGFSYLAHLIMTSAQKSKGFVFLLEGGYNLEGTAESVKEVILTMMEAKTPIRSDTVMNIDSILYEAKKHLKIWLE